MTITYEGVMGFPKTEAEWAERASRHLKAELKRAGITYAGLANLLRKHGLRDETKAGVSSKLARGRFTETFFLASLGAIGNSVTSSGAYFKKGVISREPGIRMEEYFQSTQDIDKVSLVCSMPLMGDVRTLSHY
jgi:hypothetical protein